MSAYIVDRNHILFLVLAAQSRRLNPHGDFSWHHNNTTHRLSGHAYDRAAEVANMLWMENVKSVAHRYGDAGGLPGPKDQNYTVRPHHFKRDIPIEITTFDPVQVLKSIACYSYQTCEHEGWPVSEAHEFCRALKSCAIHALPGFEEANWGAPERKPGAPESKVCDLMALINDDERE